MSRQRVSIVLMVGVLLAGVWSAAVGRIADAALLELREAVFEWTVSDEANTGAFNGDCNFITAGESDGYIGTYRATDQDVTVLKLNSAGVHVPISDYSTRCLDRNGVRVTPGGSARLGQKVRFANGVGTVDPDTGASRISWKGTFSLSYYGHLTPFWFGDPVLDVDASGNGTITATVGGYASSIDDPETREKMPNRSGVVIAELRNVRGANSDGFVVTPVYDGVTYESTSNPQVRIYQGWGSWPLPLVDYLSELNLGAYFYSTGGAADPRKRPDPVVVSYGTGTAPTTTTTVPGATSTTVTSTTQPTTTSTTTTTTVASTTTTTTTPASGGSGSVPIEVVVPDGPGNGGGGDDGTEVEDGSETPGLPANTFSWTIGATGSIVLGQIPGESDEYRFGGSLGSVTVVDTRTGSPAWTLSGQVSNFNGGLKADLLGWTPRITAAGAGALPGDTVPSGHVAGSGLSLPSLLASAPAGHAPGAATIDADLDLRVPRSTTGGTYVATLTLTALG